MPADRPRVGYVAKVFPRLSETFVVNELLAHERAGVELEVFSLRPSADAGAHADHDRLLAPVTYVADGALTVGALLEAIDAAETFGNLRATLETAHDEHPRELLQAVRLARLVHERGIGHLHAHFANVAASVARIAARLTGVPYSLTAHAKDIFHEEVVPAHLSALLADAAAVITVSDFNVAHLRRVCAAAADRVHRVYNGIELERFPYSPPAGAPPRIVGVGRLVEKKGFDVLVEACGLLAGEGRVFECRIIGGGERMEALSAQVAALGLQGVVTLTGPASQEQVRAEMTSSAALAAPCVVGADGNRDGLPTVLLEAMALGTPCVATPVTGIPEVLVDGETGIEVPQRDPAALAGALGRLLDDEALRVRLAGAARRLIEERFDVDRNTALWRDVVLGPPAEEIEHEERHARRVRVL